MTESVLKTNVSSCSTELPVITADHPSCGRLVCRLSGKLSPGFNIPCELWLILVFPHDSTGRRVFRHAASEPNRTGDRGDTWSEETEESRPRRVMKICVFNQQFKKKLNTELRYIFRSFLDFYCSNTLSSYKVTNVVSLYADDALVWLRIKLATKNNSWVKNSFILYKFKFKGFLSWNSRFINKSI